MTDTSSDWNPFALLIIDVQRDFWTDEMAAAFPAFEDNVNRLLSFCRAHGIDIVHLRARFEADASDWMIRYHFLDRIPCIDGTPGVELLDCATSLDGEKVIVKQTFDGFLNPALEAYLHANGKRFLLVAGLVTSVCVLLTAAAAAQRGYLVGVVEDCCADKPEAHEHTLGRYPFVFDRTRSDRLTEDRGKWLAQLDRIRGLATPLSSPSSSG